MRLACLLVVAACNGGVAVSDYETKLRDAQCEQLVRCNEFPDVASCTPFFTINDTVFESEVSAGTIDFDSGLGNECINAIKNAPCDQTSREARTLPSACQTAVTGTIGNGDTCYSNEACQSGACATPTCPDACCAGQCIAESPPAQQGEPCATRDCADGLVCDNTKMCVPLFAEGATCLEDTDCNYGLACLGSPGVCTIVPHLGEPCPDEVCGDLGTYCATDGTCHATGLVGASCMTSQECSPFYPCNGTQCGSLPKLGETCSGLCSDGSYCDSTTLQCTARQTNGATCTGDFQCESNYCKATCQDPQACG